MLWDITYQGVGLRQAAWDAHLAILRAYIAGHAPPESNDSAYAEATVALHRDGRILYCASCEHGTPSPSTPFHWCRYQLTEYGRLYAQQRLK